ncbi:unnamed protein product [Paramecium sonneborni]|uniref:Sm domain-containing protein n=1 Tax=Paramecium sonneborni TaxID=65129 RepID=A0A8S1MJT5_9CILI|nr:unnamed protein product [Paramecium sonneborni]
MSHEKRTSADFFKQVFGRTVTVKLHNRTEYIGVLAALDGNMNIVLEQCEEYLESKLINKYGQILLRGNNVLYISAKFNQTKQQDVEI